MQEQYIPSRREYDRTLTFGQFTKPVLNSRTVAHHPKVNERKAYQNGILKQTTPVQLSDAAVIPSATPFKIAIRNASYNLNGNKQDLKYYPRDGALPLVRGTEGDNVSNEVGTNDATEETSDKEEDEGEGGDRVGGGSGDSEPLLPAELSEQIAYYRQQLVERESEEIFQSTSSGAQQGAVGGAVVGGTAGAVAGGATGATAGATFGSVAGPVGTILGGVVGGIGGAIGGAIAGGGTAGAVTGTIGAGAGYYTSKNASSEELAVFDAGVPNVKSKNDLLKLVDRAMRAGNIRRNSAATETVVGESVLGLATLGAASGKGLGKQILKGSATKVKSGIQGVKNVLNRKKATTTKPLSRRRSSVKSTGDIGTIGRRRSLLGERRASTGRLTDFNESGTPYNQVGGRRKSSTDTHSTVFDARQYNTENNDQFVIGSPSVKSVTSPNSFSLDTAFPTDNNPAKARSKYVIQGGNVVMGSQGSGSGAGKRGSLQSVDLSAPGLPPRRKSTANTSMDPTLDELVRDSRDITSASITDPVPISITHTDEIIPPNRPNPGVRPNTIVVNNETNAVPFPATNRPTTYRQGSTSSNITTVPAVTPPSEMITSNPLVTSAPPPRKVVPRRRQRRASTGSSDEMVRNTGRRSSAPNIMGRGATRGRGRGSRRNSNASSSSTTSSSSTSITSSSGYATGPRGGRGGGRGGRGGGRGGGRARGNTDTSTSSGYATDTNPTLDTNPPSTSTEMTPYIRRRSTAAEIVEQNRQDQVDYSGPSTGRTPQSPTEAIEQAIFEQLPPDNGMRSPDFPASAPPATIPNKKTRQGVPKKEKGGTGKTHLAPKRHPYRNEVNDWLAKNRQRYPEEVLLEIIYDSASYKTGLNEKYSSPSRLKARLTVEAKNKKARSK